MAESLAESLPRPGHHDASALAHAVEPVGQYFGEAVEVLGIRLGLGDVRRPIGGLGRGADSIRRPPVCDPGTGFARTRLFYRDFRS